jgi:excisionase family DNA binding protein
MGEHNSSAWLTVSQAAALLGVSERTVRRRCESGQLSARLMSNGAGKTWLISVAATNAAVTATEKSTPVAADTDSATTFLSANVDGNETGADTGADNQIARLEGYVARDMEIILGHAVEQAVSTVVSPLLERIESQAAVHALLMEELKELRKDRTALKAELAKLIEAQQSLPEAIKVVTTDALEKAVAPYMSEVEVVRAEVDNVHQENARLKIELEDARNPWWKFWRGLKAI